MPYSPSDHWSFGLSLNFLFKIASCFRVTAPVQPYATLGDALDLPSSVFVRHIIICPPPILTEAFKFSFICHLLSCHQICHLSSCHHICHKSPCHYICHFSSYHHICHSSFVITTFVIGHLITTLVICHLATTFVICYLKGKENDIWHLSFVFLLPLLPFVIFYLITYHHFCHLSSCHHICHSSFVILSAHSFLHFLAPICHLSFAIMSAH